MHALPLTLRRLLRSVLLLAGTVALAGSAAIVQPAGATADEGRNRGAYLGRWNYDQPDRESMRNIAVLQCPTGSTTCVGPGPGGGPLEVPQIGDILFSEGPHGTVVGRTDVGCTWSFALRSSALELAPTGQSCFNEVNGVAYTITSWSVTVHGNRQREVITAVSHRPTGGDYEFVLENGRRTRAPEPGRPGAARGFTGTWEYTPAIPEANVNMVANREIGPEGERFSISPQTGLVTITAARDGTIIARTPDSCRWRLVIRGNTAALASEPQTCQLSDSTVTLTHWTIASNGRHQVSRLRGVEETDTTTATFLLSIGDLRRCAPGRRST